MKKIVHIIEIQYFKDYTTNSKSTDMHDLKTIYKKVRTTLKTKAKECFVYGENHRKYPNVPKMSDLEIVSLLISAECLGISSENLLYSKIRKDYSKLFPNLIHRTRFNSRKKSLRDLILRCTDLLAQDLIQPEDKLIIDSIPVPTCKLIRERNSKACQRPEYDQVLANKGFNKILGGYFIGYKFHLITTERGVYKDLLITSANEHDNCFLKILSCEDNHLRGKEMLGDRGYIGKPIQLSLFEEIDLKLTVPYRRNQKDYTQYDISKKLLRKTIEVVLSQYCDEYDLRRNYAKRFNGFDIRVISKVAAKTFKQYWNYLHGKPINQTKHALAA